MDRVGPVTMALSRGPFQRVLTVAWSWPFLTSAVLLLVNDLYLKGAYSNWVTGKLSDLSGMFLVSLILFSAFPGQVGGSAALLATGFVIWKSPLSQPFIDFVRGLGLDQFGRVVDYSDLIALAMVPLGRVVAGRLDRYRPPRTRITTMLSWPALALALLAVVGTSFVSYRESYILRKTTAAETFDGTQAATLIAEVSKRHGLTCVVCDRIGETAEYRGDSITMRYFIRDDRSIVFHVQGTAGFFSGIPRDRMQTLARDLRTTVGRQITNMEFVIPLPEP